MRINKEGYKIIGISGAVCVFLWWLIYHLLVSDANISLLWVSAVLLLLFWFFIVAFSGNPAACASTMPTSPFRPATAASS